MHQRTASDSQRQVLRHWSGHTEFNRQAHDWHIFFILHDTSNLWLSVINGRGRSQPIMGEDVIIYGTPISMLGTWIIMSEKHTSISEHAFHINMLLYKIHSVIVWFIWESRVISTCAAFLQQTGDRETHTYKTFIAPHKTYLAIAYPCLQTLTF